MKVLVLGASGMIGHKMWQYLSKINPNETYATLHGNYEQYSKLKIFPKEKSIESFQAENFEQVTETLNKIQPNILINAIGITIRKGLETDPNYTKTINSKLPHFLDKWCSNNKAHLYHFSTDCVFSGQTDSIYSERDSPDAKDLYGSSKAAGEVINSPHTLTIRASMIGRELRAHTELLEWFLQQPKNAKLKGFTKALYSGVTTLKMAEYVWNLIQQHPQKSGLLQISSPPISKYNLLCLVKEVWQRHDIEIEAINHKSVNKSLNADHFFSLIKQETPNWTSMLEDMKKEDSFYQELG